MARLLPSHKETLQYGSYLAERLVRKETSMDVGRCYDISTLRDGWLCSGDAHIFAQVMRLESEGRVAHYRVCLQDEGILEFVERNPDIDMLTFLVYIMTHELVHINRFVTGKADFMNVSNDEEILVDNIARLLLAKHPVTGMARVLNILDKIIPPPLYNFRTVFDQGGIINAYL